LTDPETGETIGGLDIDPKIGDKVVRTKNAVVDEIVELGALDPEAIVTPGIFVNRVVAVGERRWLRNGEFVGGVNLEGEAL
jgi:3-oxoadipate CoA-transferase alpha subunit